jgi:DNA-directed RNA polymerase specialized sigma subunit
VERARREERDRLALPLITMACAGCSHATGALVELHRPLIGRMAARLRPPPGEREEFVSVGVEAFLVALGRYDPARGVPLWGYAHRVVRGRMIEYFGRISGLTPHQTSAYRAVWRAFDALLADPARAGRHPSASEVAARMRALSRRRVGIETIEAVLRRGRRREASVEPSEAERLVRAA